MSRHSAFEIRQGVKKSWGGDMIRLPYDAARRWGLVRDGNAPISEVATGQILEAAGRERASAQDPPTVEPRPTAKRIRVQSVSRPRHLKPRSRIHARVTHDEAGPVANRTLQPPERRP